MQTADTDIEDRIYNGMLSGRYGEVLFSPSVTDGGKIDASVTLVDPKSGKKVVRAFSGIEEEDAKSLRTLIESGRTNSVIPEAVKGTSETLPTSSINDTWKTMGEEAPDRVLSSKKRLQAPGSISLEEGLTHLFEILDRQATAFTILKSAHHQVNDLIGDLQRDPSLKTDPEFRVKGEKLHKMMEMGHKAFSEDQGNIGLILDKIGIRFMPPSQAADMLLKMAEAVDQRKAQIVQSHERQKAASLRPDPVSKPGPETAQHDHVEKKQTTSVDPENVHRINILDEFSRQMKELAEHLRAGEASVAHMDDLSKNLRESSKHLQDADVFHAEAKTHLKTAFAHVAGAAMNVGKTAINHLHQAGSSPGPDTPIRMSAWH